MILLPLGYVALTFLDLCLLGFFVRSKPSKVVMLAVEAYLTSPRFDSTVVVSTSVLIVGTVIVRHFMRRALGRRRLRC